MGMYDKFKTDPTTEKTGVVLNYGDFRVTVARSGGANKAYQRLLENKTRPYQRAMATGVMDNELALDIVKEVFAETVVLNWEVKEGVDSWIEGVESPDGEILPFNKENVMVVFKELPDLFSDIRAQSDNMQLFRAGLRDELGKGSAPASSTSSSKGQSKKAS